MGSADAGGGAGTETSRNRRWLTQPGSGLVARRRLKAIRTAIDRPQDTLAATRSAGIRVCANYPVAAATERSMKSTDTGSDETAGDVR
jgi:hypothetical protein